MRPAMMLLIRSTMTMSASDHDACFAELNRTLKSMRSASSKSFINTDTCDSSAVRALPKRRCTVCIMLTKNE
jgi:hypothetical protein